MRTHIHFNNILSTFKALYICVHVICTPNSGQSNVIHHIYIYIYIFKIQQRSYLVHTALIFVRSRLESTNAAPEVPHPRPTQDAASNMVARASIRVCVFFFFLDSRRLCLIRTDAARFMPNRLRLAPNWADSAISGCIGRQPIRPKHAGNGRNMPKSALNMAGKAETCLLLSFFVNQAIVMCFLRIFS